MLFNFSLIMGTMLAISADSWLITWTGMEVNLLALMPLMSFENNKLSSEATIKYFLIQAMASSIFLFGAIFYSMSSASIFINSMGTTIITLALLLKMGIAPLHFWLPEVISGSNWKIIFIVLTLQKIAPMMILFYTTMEPLMLSIFIMMSSIISGIQGLNQTCLKKIMAYSSINHSSWMVAAMMNSISLWFCYFSVYLLISLNIITILSKFNVKSIIHLNYLFSSNKMIKFMFLLNFLNLGGLPPFLGFLPKWLVVMKLIENNYYMLATILIIFTLITLYFYIRIALLSFSINMTETLIIFFNKMNYLFIMINIMSLISLISCSLLINYI
uniref:NADH-ubiquinone oxidoreductase chain 2 n=1 Tax=Cryptorhynchinae sp. 7 ACP-2013 TaxID=1434468 RepID=A0A3G5FNA8_9CUCU|nr:NADH dehydrogenase subunit 2 [Cryptorhynchinae sp. 7 ACP-2013]